MKTGAIWLATAVGLALASGCGTVHAPDGGAEGGAPLPPVPDFPWIDKAVFEGEWFYGATVERVDGSVEDLGAASATVPFVGALAVVGEGDAPTLGRVRFRVGEDALIAVSVVDEEPVAAFAIVGHRDLDPDAPPRPWHERTHVRVDWSVQLVASAGLFGASMDENDTFVRFEREPASFFDPARPTAFEAVATDPSAVAEWPSGSDAVVHRIGASTNELWSQPECATALCDPLEVVWRHELLRVAPGRSYVAARYYEDEQARFGLSHVPFGETIAHRARRRTWGGGHAERACRDDAECSRGTRCDVTAGLCEAPLDGRTFVPITLHLDPAYPPHLVRGAFAAVAEWNEAFMVARRALEGRAPPVVRGSVPCQSADPAAWCFCAPDAVAPEVDGGECRPQPTLFALPEARVQDDPYDCWIEGPPDLDRPTSPESYGPEEARFRFVGSECAVTLTLDERALGDLRSSPLRHVPDARFCGMAQPRLDPSTGEIVTSALHTGGGCLDEVARVSEVLWPVLRDETASVIPGDPAFDGYFERIARAAVVPTPPPGGGGGSPLTVRGPAIVRTPSIPLIDDMRLAPLWAAAGSALEEALVTPVFEEAALATRQDDPLRAARLGLSGARPTSAAQIAAFSPVGGGPIRAMMENEARDRLLVHHFVFPPRFAHYAAGPQRWWARAYRGRPDASVRWRQLVHRAMVTRLVGHALGLTANLAASIDRDQYPDRWFPAGLENALPTPEAFDANGDNVITAGESIEFMNAYRVAMRARLDRGLGHASSASVLDVHGDLSDLAGVGRYDRAAIFYDYFDRVEMDDVPFAERERAWHAERGTEYHYTPRSDAYGRSLWRWYGGGESCSADADCPFGPGSPSLARGQVTHQRCIEVGSPISVPCETTACECSSFGNDSLDYVEGAGPPEWYGADRLPEHRLVSYQHCSVDEAANALCNLDDAGDSYVAVQIHARDTWRELYPFAYGPDPSIASPTARFTLGALRAYQDLFHRYFYEPTFRRAARVLGFNDLYRATVYGLASLAELATLPDEGAYARRALDGSYSRVADGSAGELVLPLGVGFRHASGASGAGRRRGVRWDRLLAMLVLTQGGIGYTRDDVELFGRFGDLYDAEMAQLLGGMLADMPGDSGPFLAASEGGDPVSLAPSRLVGFCRDPMTGEVESCRPPSGLSAVGAPMNTGTPLSRRWAGALSLLREPPRAQVFDAFAAPPWPTFACAFGEPIAGSGDPICADEGDAAYALYRSEGGSAWVASRSLERPRQPEYPEAGYALLRELIRRRARLAELETLPATSAAELAELRDAVAAAEARAAELEELARLAGIAEWRPPME